MWVLEAWQDAEKVWYPVVWEEKKDPSNVVDYDIHEEITKDASNVINANNDTTTGMATVIPWINAPKLKEETSIYWWWWVKIVEISDYTSVDERQPIVNSILSWEWLVVHCAFTEWSALQKLYFTPFINIDSSIIRFGWMYVGDHWFRINCWLSWKTVTSVTTAHWAW